MKVLRAQRDAAVEHHVSVAVRAPDDAVFGRSGILGTEGDLLHEILARAHAHGQFSVLLRFPSRGLRAREGSEGTFERTVVFIVSLRRNIKIARLRLNRRRVIMTQHFLQ